MNEYATTNQWYFTDLNLWITLSTAPVWGYVTKPIWIMKKL